MADLTGLTADSGYRWRVVSTNSSGTSTVEGQVFSTLSVASAGGAMSFGQAIDAVVGEAGFDTQSSNLSRQTVGRWVNAAHKEMVRKSRLLGEQRLLASTVAGQSAYAIDPDILEIQTLVVGGVPYGRRGRRELRLIQGFTDRRLAPGLWFPTYSGDKVTQFSLDPAPDVDGTPILADVFVAAPTMTDEAQDFLVVPFAFCEHVIDRAAAFGLKRVEGNVGLANDFIQEFESACEQLRRNVNQRSGGSPTQLRVVG